MALQQLNCFENPACHQSSAMFEVPIENWQRATRSYQIHRGAFISLSFPQGFEPFPHLFVTHGSVAIQFSNASPYLSDLPIF